MYKGHTLGYKLNIKMGRSNNHKANTTTPSTKQKTPKSQTKTKIKENCQLRNSFISWLAILCRLSTHDRIFKFTPGPLVYVLCSRDMETHDHLFFSCSFSSFVWQSIMQHLAIVSHPTSQGALVEWAAGRWKHKEPSHIIPKLFFGAAVYHVWKERNAKTFRMESKHAG